VEQTSNIQQHAVPHRMEDGQALSREEWEKNVDFLLDQLHWGMQLHVASGSVFLGLDKSRC
jgi:mannose-6-phosphate isomerase